MIPHTLYSSRLVLLTPCFCAGAYASQAELRATSFRGALRWWFRCLGGTREQEARIFGSVAVAATRSAVSLSVSAVNKRRTAYDWEYERPTPPTKPKNSSFITYPITAKGERTEGYLAPDTTFTLELRQTAEVSAEDPPLLQLAWDCLCNLGSVGLRATRALGAYAPAAPAERRAAELLQDAVVSRAFRSRVLPKDYGPYQQPETTRALLTDAARLLADYRDKNGLHAAGGKWKSAGVYYGPSALGNAINGRQQSAVRFRPILSQEGKLQLCVLEAPSFTLGAQAAAHDIESL